MTQAKGAVCTLAVALDPGPDAEGGKGEPVVLLRTSGQVRGRPEWFEPHEVARCVRLREPAARAGYVAAHTLLRLAAAELTGRAPEFLRLGQECPGCGGTDHGRPHLAGLPGVHLSLSHAGAHVAVVAAHQPCGIDVEPRSARPVPLRAFAEPERRWLASGTGHRDDLVLWTAKEALVKAGHGSLSRAAEIVVGTPSGPRSTVAGFALRHWY